MSNKTKKIIMIAIIIFIFLFMYLLNYKTFLVSDDYPYQFIFTGRIPDSNTKLISNPLDIFISMKNHWFLWGGRVSVHYMLQLVFMLGITFFNIFNSLMYILLGWLIYKHVNEKNDINLGMLIFIYASIFLFIPQPGSTIMWKSGSANYLWASVLLLSMSLIYKKHYDNNSKIKNNLKNAILIFLLGLITGCCNENSGCALIFTQILFIITYKFKDKYIPKWAISGLIGTIISYIFLIISPGNYIRAREMYPNVQYGITNIFEYILKITRLSFSYLMIPLIILIITTVIIYNKNDSIKKLKNKYLIQFIFLLFSLTSIYSLVLSPAYPERSWTFAFVYILVIICLNLKRFNYKNEFISKSVAILIIILTMFSINEYCTAFYEINISYNELKEQFDYIEQQKKNNHKQIVVHEIINHEGKYNAFKDNGYIGSDEKGWLNLWVSKYLEIDSIKVVD